MLLTKIGGLDTHFMQPSHIFERELALLVALRGESSWKGGHCDVHWKASGQWVVDKSRRQNLHTN